MKVIKNFNEIKDIIYNEVLASQEYLKYMGREEYGYFVDKGYVLPFYIKKKFIFKYMCFTTDILGTQNEMPKYTFMENVILYIKKHSYVDFILSLHVTALFDCYPQNSLFCKFGSYIIDLTLGEDILFSKIHGKHRNVIKKAQKDGVVIQRGDVCKSDCITLVLETLKREKLDGVTKSVLEKLSNVRRVDYWTAQYDGATHGAAILLWRENGSVYYLYGGSASFSHTGAMNLLHWEAIKYMKANNVLSYDFVGARIDPAPGSKYEGIQRFKSRFGGEFKQGFLWKYPVNKFKYLLYYFLVFIKYRGKFHGDIIDQERKRGN